MNISHEALREREVLKYDGDYVSRSIINHLGSKEASQDSSEGENGSSTLPPVLSSATDSGLTSLAQLATFRLGCKRALISLWDRNFQYIVAEATQNLPLQPGVRHPDLWLCGTAIPRSHGICEHVLVAPHGATLPVSVVPDLADDARFSDRNYIDNAPFNRFYAGVPIRSHRGINIGVLCVFDDKPHSGLDDESIQYLQDLSRNIMSYLEARRVRDAASRHEKMVRGLGSFVEGGSRISGLDPRLPEQPSIQPSLQFTPPSSDVGECGTPYVRQSELKRQLLDHDIDPLLQPISTGEARATTECLLDVPQTPPRPVDPAIVRSNSDSFIHLKPAPAAPSPNVTDAKGPSHFSEVKQVFAKAANIIRQSIDVDGVVFLDASIRSFGGLVDANGGCACVPSESLSSPSSGDESVTSSVAGTERMYGSPFCSVLGFSTEQQSSLNNDPAEPGYSLVKEKFLRSLLRRYPKGHIMNFDSEGLVIPGDSSSSEDDSMPRRNSRKSGKSELSEISPMRLRARQSWTSQVNFLLKIFPGIRSLAILPIWDASRERWYAGGFVFTTSSSRVFTSDGELGFLKTFGKAIQTELIQVETTFSEKAKSDALGSLSHELRSPLHGLLGACELLHDTRMSAFQKDMLRMAETSGRTLLDVIDHLLDYSKMSSIRGYPDHSPSTSRKSAQNLGFLDSENQYLSDIEVDLVIEEVVESVFTGHSFQKIVTSNMSRQSAPKKIDGAPRRLSSAPVGNSTRSHAYSCIADGTQVAVYLDIDSGHSWQMLAYPGAIRRIIMNLLGNSLKFTNEGFIFVSLKQESLTRSKRGVDIVLTIIDSGRGISEDFLQHQLFKPFTQEDKLSPGTGLGLNVVKQIINMLQGHITVVSQSGLGTKTVVTIPLTYSSEPTPIAGQFLPNVNVLTGQSVHLMGFERVLHTPFLSSRRMDEKNLLSRLCRDWFGMNIIKSTDWETGPIPSILIANESSLKDVESLKSSGKIACPVVIVCHNSVTAHDLSTNAERMSWRSGLHFITQPIGPRKLAEAIVYSIQQYKQHAEGGDLVPSEPVTPMEYYTVPSSTGSYNFGNVSGPLSTSSPQTDRSASPESACTSVLTSTSVDSPRKSEALEAPEVGAKKIAEGLASRLNYVVLDESQTPPKDPGSASKSQTREPRFLVVDDNKINVQILSSFLKKLKKTHSTAMDGLEALETYTSTPSHFDYVFMDISMPRMDGLEATRRIRSFEREKQLRQPAKIIALTGLVSEDMQKEAFASGIDMFLTKPVKLQQLRDIIGEKA